MYKELWAFDWNLPFLYLVDHWSYFCCLISIDIQKLHLHFDFKYGAWVTLCSRGLLPNLSICFLSKEKVVFSVLDLWLFFSWSFQIGVFEFLPTAVISVSASTFLMFWILLCFLTVCLVLPLCFSQYFISQSYWDLLFGIVRFPGKVRLLRACWNLIFLQVFSQNCENLKFSFSEAIASFQI